MRTNIYSLLLPGLMTIMACENTKLKSELLAFQEKENLEKQNLEVIKNFYTHLDRQDTVSLAALLDQDFMSYFGSADDALNYAQLSRLIRDFYTAFPDYRHEVLHSFASGDYVASLLSYTGTHLNVFMGLEASGKKIAYKGIFLFKLKNGRIQELWGIEDDLTLLTQIGHELR